MLDKNCENVKTKNSLLALTQIKKLDDEVAAEIVDILSDYDKLIQAGIEVLNCSGKNANLKDANRVRVFAIDKVKGMEFDVVFFYDIDNISDDEDMINKYLYVALSRAAFFMAVTSDGSNQEISDKLKSMFGKNFSG